MTKHKTTHHTRLKAWLASVALALPMLSGAHDLVLVPETSGSLTVRFGHPGDWSLPDKYRVLDLQAEGDVGPAKLLAPGMTAKGVDWSVPEVVGSGKASMATARYDNGLWVTVPDAAGKLAYFNTSKAMLPQAKASVASIKFAKALYASTDDTTVWKRETKHLIEVIPQRNPATVKAGETLAVLVKFNGKPLAKAGVGLTDGATTASEEPKGFVTNAAGIAQVPIRQAGLNVIAVDHFQVNDGSLGPAMKALPVDSITMVATYAFLVR